jgi:hypothetical protein
MKNKITMEDKEGIKQTFIVSDLEFETTYNMLFNGEGRE